MTIKKKRFLPVFFLLLCFAGHSQSDWQLGLLPGVSINKEVGEGWKLNLAIQSRQAVLAGDFDGETSRYEYILTDFTFLASKELKSGNILKAGYLMRFEGKKLIQRLIQRFIITRKYERLSLAQRFTTDQTFESGEKVQYRLRYRVGMEWPFQGKAAGSPGWYFKFQNEYLNSLQDNEYDFEIRLIPLLGYKFSDKNKVEFGLDYRMESIIKSPAHIFWLNLGWETSF